MRQYIPYISLVISFLGFTASLTVANHSPTLKKISIMLAVLALFAGTLEVAERWIKTRAESITSEARIAESQAKASIAAAELATYRRDAEIKAAEAEKRLRELKSEQVKAVTQRDVERKQDELRTQKLDAELKRLQRLLDQEQQAARSRQQQAEQDMTQRASAFCTRCCETNAPRLMPHSAQAVGVCIGECMARKPSNWFVNGEILCKQ